MTTYIQPFVTGGLLVAGIKYLSNNVNTKLGAIFGAAPIGLMSSYYITHLESAKTYSHNYFIMLIVGVILAFSYHNFLNNNVTKNKSILYSIALWFIIGFVLYNYTNILHS